MVQPCSSVFEHELLSIISTSTSQSAVSASHLMAGTYLSSFFGISGWEEFL